MIFTFFLCVFRLYFWSIFYTKNLKNTSGVIIVCKVLKKVFLSSCFTGNRELQIFCNDAKWLATWTLECKIFSFLDIFFALNWNIFLLTISRTVSAPWLFFRVKGCLYIYQIQLLKYLCNIAKLIVLSRVRVSYWNYSRSHWMSNTHAFIASDFGTSITRGSN